MPIKKPLGVTIVASLLTVVGGFSSVIIFFELIDSVRFFGPSSIGISSIISLYGFLVYAGTPLLLYFTGVGLFMSQRWCWWSVVYMIPALVFCFFANLAYAVALRASIALAPSPWDVIVENTDIFVNIFLRYILIISPLVFYFTRPVVVFFFESQKPA